MGYTIEELAVKFAMGTLDPSGCTKTEMSLLSMYMNDSNSSTLRQLVMCNVAGLKTNPNKLGFDGLDSVVEMKPKNINTELKSKKKLDIGGSYSDMTIPRHNKFIEQNALIHSGGFVNGTLVYQLEITYGSLVPHFQKQLDKFFMGKHEKNKYLRSMYFSYKQVQEFSDPKVLFITDNLSDYRKHMSKAMYEYLVYLKSTITKKG